MGVNIDIRGLSFGFGAGGHRIEDVSLAVPDATMCCLLGPNGAGKTTLLRCLLGLLRPERGTVRLAGHDVSALSPRQLARIVAYVPQSTTPAFPFTALDMAVMGRTPHLGMTATPSPSDRRAAQLTLDDLGIGHLAGRPFTQLSGGERQLTMLARALVQEAAVLVLDEPTSALDYGNEVRILKTVADVVSQGPSALLTTHQPNHALMWADLAVLMSHGSIVESGRPRDVITAERLSDLYRVGIDVARLPGRLPGQQDRLVCLPDVAGIAASSLTHAAMSEER